jgi:hypothetical protein
MPRPYASGVVPASADQVWAAVRDFNGMPAWHPGIESSSLTSGGSGTEAGAVRRLAMVGGGDVVERLLTIDDSDRSYTYEIVESPFAVRRYVSTIRLAPVTDSGHTFVEWWSEYDAEAGDEERLTDLFAGGIYAAGIEALRTRFAGT